MQIHFSPLTLTKRYPLTISRGTSAGSENLLVEVTHDGLTGVGEFAPTDLGGGIVEDAANARADIARWESALEPIAPWQMQRVEAVLNSLGGGRAARAALDIALHDWLGKRAQMPVYQLMGGDPGVIAPTSLTIGINSPDVVRVRIPTLIADFHPKVFKVKLGSPEGVEADRAMFTVVREVTPPEVALRVDANGGWSVEEARSMIAWLATLGVEYIEQPLHVGQEDDLPAVRHNSPLPIFADESCRIAADVPKLADRVDGINLKLMKAGGIREGLRVIHAARAHGLKVMIGCMSESSLAIAAATQLAPFADYLDLDSHLNLAPDPFTGLTWDQGRVLPSEKPGLGVEAVKSE